MKKTSTCGRPEKSSEIGRANHNRWNSAHRNKKKTNKKETKKTGIWRFDELPPICFDEIRKFPTLHCDAKTEKNLLGISLTKSLHGTIFGYLASLGRMFWTNFNHRSNGLGYLNEILLGNCLFGWQTSRLWTVMNCTPQ